ncbi:MAG: sulfur carrier protein ThiS [Hyphomicrobium sp.]|nr:sulfur carrier protein ThiS [Hyphomicrobium sp.]
MTDPQHELTVILNGQPSVALVDNLAALVAENGYDGARVATALNGVFVPVGQRATTPLRPGDRIEILSARQGG